MQKVNLYVEEKMYAELKSISEETGIPVSRLIRNALKVVIAEYETMTKHESKFLKSK